MAGARVQAVLAALEAEPGLTAREVADRTGLLERLVHMVLWRLEGDGRVAHEGRRWYPRQSATSRRT